MRWKATRGAVVRGGAMLLAVMTAAASCGNGTRRAPPELSRGPVQPAPTHAGPLPDMRAAVEHSPLTLAAPLPAGTVVDARVLVISADGTDSELAAIEQTLGYLGTPFDVLIANQAPALTAS